MLSMTIYSGEFLPILFSKHGTPNVLQLCPEDGAVYDTDYYDDQQGVCKLKMPLVLRLEARDQREDLVKKGERLCSVCSRMLQNVTSRTRHEYIFKLENGRDIIMAGSTSFHTFRNNFLLRLAEVFFNLEWIHQSAPEYFRMSEFLLYENCYKELLVADNTGIPEVLNSAYSRLKMRLDSAQTRTSGL
jgi:hypothetical protein